MNIFLVRLIAAIAFGIAAFSAIDANALALTGVKSRKMHGAAGTFDLPIDTAQAFGASVTVEPRIIGSGHTIVFQFDSTITATGTASSMDAFGPVGSVSAAITGASNTPANNEVSVMLTGVPDNKRVTISLAQVNGVLDVAASMGFLVGDVNNTRSVNSTDISNVKARSGRSAASTLFVFDVNASGTINSSDISAVKARSGLTLPAANEVSLLVSKVGTGAGVISSSPVGINCGIACAANFTHNSSVTLTAAPNTGSTFSGWSGLCSGVSLSSTILLGSNSSCTATFTINTYAVTPSVNVNGTISPSTAQTVNYGGAAIFTITPNSGFMPVVGGSCGGTLTGTTYTTNAITGACTVVASFSSVPTWYISPLGNDSSNGQTPGTAWKTFVTAFSGMASGDQLILLDGQYSSSTTGVMHWDTSIYGVNSAQAPSGVSLVRMTIVRALNPGKVTINGPLFVGRSARKDSFILIQGVTFEGTGELYNTSFNTIKDCGFHGAFSIGTADHQNGNTDNLIEDVWVWATGERIIAINYQADRNVWRRLVVRGDGCGTAACNGSGNPNVGFTVYDSRDASVQNVIVVDRILAGSDEPYANFATAQHTANSNKYLGRNEWLGAMSINPPDSGFTFEADATIPIDPTWTMKDVVVFGSGSIDGINVAANGRLILSNATLVAATQFGSGIRVAPGSIGTSMTNTIVKGFNWGLNSSLQPSYTDTFGSATLYNQTTPTVGVRLTNPTADGATPSLKYPTRIEAGSVLKGTGLGGADYGANVVNKIGVDGSRFGEPNYNTVTANALWPWPNQARIKLEMCAGTTRGFCAIGTRLDGLKPISLTSYIWEQLANPVPNSVDP